jgi:predicted  nucleic acid-binding Zn-ribbon protein
MLIFTDVVEVRVMEIRDITEEIRDITEEIRDITEEIRDITEEIKDITEAQTLDTMEAEIQVLVQRGLVREFGLV